MLTSSQQLALDTSRHLSVTANAGSGKTMVLVERYIDILISGKARVGEVVAITFTEKAAGELKRKIAENVSKRIAEISDASLRNRLEEIREQLSGAVIGTIHAFCSRILREYPVEARVDAAFTVIEGVDQRSLLEAALKKTIDEVLREDEASLRRRQLFTMLRALGKEKVLNIVRTLVKKREQAGRWLVDGGVFTLDDESILALWRSAITEHVTSELNDPAVESTLNEVISYAPPKAQNTFRAAALEIPRSKSIAERVMRFAGLIDEMLTQKGDLRAKVFGNSGDNAKAAATRLHRKYRSVEHFGKFLRDPSNQLHKDLLADIKIFLDLYASVMQTYEETKTEQACLDFDDLQIRTKELLSGEHIRQKLARRFKFIMVDEYQDTNKLQYEILLPLVDELKKGNLFIVGDPKQSIYGFRDADVAVFNQTKRTMGEVAGSESEIYLRDSFRPLRDVAAFVNLVFGNLMGAREGSHEVGYEPLVCGRDNPAPGRVEIILRKENKDLPEEDTLSEQQLIARRIVQLVSQRTQIYDKSEAAHDVRFSDFAVLLRSRTGLSKLEQAFIQYNIPYLVSGGIGYYQTQGVYDFYNYFCFLLNTDDDVALAGILRSPFFNVSDAEMFEAAYGRSGPSLWQYLQSEKRKGKKIPSLEAAVETLKRDIAVASRISVPDLIIRIVNQTSYAGFVAGTVRGSQTMANLEKLKRLAQRYEEQGFTNLFDFAGRLKRLIEEENEEGQAAVDSQANAVKVMTIHSAKGLEFPIVILPTLERTPQYDKEPFFDESLGFGFSLTSDEREENPAPLTALLKLRSNAKNIAEEKRVFYVACSRARDMVMLSATVKKSSGSYLSWLQDVLGLDAEETIAELSFDVETEFVERKDATYVPVVRKHSLRVPVLREEDLRELGSYASPEPDETTGRRSLMLEPVETQTRGEIFSASKIRTYAECPAKYYLRYHAGLPVSSIRFFDEPMDEEESDVSIPADLRGRAFHYLLQHVATLPRTEQDYVAELHKFIARDSLSVLSEPSIELTSVAQSALKVIGSKFWRTVEKGTDARTEFTIMMPFGENFLTGTLDRVYRDEEGVWSVLDFKTDSGTESTLAHKAQLYEPQVKFYALLVQKFFAAPSVRANLLFTSISDAPVQFLYTQSQLGEFEKELHEIVRKIQHSDFEMSLLPCADCPLAPEGCRF